MLLHNRILIAAGLAGLSLATPAYAGEVTVTLSNVMKDRGDLYISLQNEQQFMKDDGVAGEIVENPQSDTVTVILPDVPDGDYALMVWHDIDRDGVFSMGAMGPTDGWAMIGAAELRALPTFAAQSFTVSGEKTSVTERVLYSEGSQ